MWVVFIGWACISWPGPKPTLPQAHIAQVHSGSVHRDGDVAECLRTARAATTQLANRSGAAGGGRICATSQDGQLSVATWVPTGRELGRDLGRVAATSGARGLDVRYDADGLCGFVFAGHLGGDPLRLSSPRTSPRRLSRTTRTALRRRPRRRPPPRQRGQLKHHPADDQGLPTAQIRRRGGDRRVGEQRDPRVDLPVALSGFKAR